MVKLEYLAKVDVAAQKLDEGLESPSMLGTHEALKTITLTIKYRSDRIHRVYNSEGIPSSSVRQEKEAFR